MNLTIRERITLERLLKNDIARIKSDPAEAAYFWQLEELESILTKLERERPLPDVEDNEGEAKGQIFPIN